jgi:hypothetical protein
MKTKIVLLAACLSFFFAPNAQATMCGLKGTLTDRIRDCHTQKVVQGASWNLVLRTLDGKEYWEDERQKIIWSSDSNKVADYWDSNLHCKSLASQFGFTDVSFRLPETKDYKGSVANGAFTIMPNWVRKNWSDWENRFWMHFISPLAPYKYNDLMTTFVAWPYAGQLQVDFGSHQAWDQANVRCVGQRKEEFNPLPHAECGRLGDLESRNKDCIARAGQMASYFAEGYDEFGVYYRHDYRFIAQTASGRQVWLSWSNYDKQKWVWADRPDEKMNFSDAKSYCSNLAAKLTASPLNLNFRLPSESDFDHLSLQSPTSYHRLFGQSFWTTSGKVSYEGKLKNSSALSKNAVFCVADAPL